MGQAMSLPRFLPQGDDRDLRRGWPRSRISVGQHYTSGRPQVVYLSSCPWESAGLIKDGDMGSLPLTVGQSARSTVKNKKMQRERALSASLGLWSDQI